MHSRRTYVLVLAGALALATPAGAQGVFNMGMLTNTLTQGASPPPASAPDLRAALRSMSGRAAAAGPADAAALNYRPDPAVRRRTQQQLVARLQRADPKTAAELQATFARRDVVEEVNRLLPAVGLRPNALPDAMALYLVTAWYGVRGSTDTKPADYAAVRAQATRALAANSGLAGASDAVKQELAEGLLLQAVFAEQAVNAAQAQPASLAKVRAAIAQGARTSLGLDLERMQLRADGLS